MDKIMPMSWWVSQTINIQDGEKRYEYGEILYFLKNIYLKNQSKRVFDISLPTFFNNKMINLPELNNNLKLLINLPELINKLEPLTILPKLIDNLKSLTHLYISNNELTNLPESIRKLSSLTRLEINNNELTNFPESIVNLKLLYQSHNIFVLNRYFF